MVLLSRIELPTSPLPMECSTTELQQLANSQTLWHITQAMTETQDKTTQGKTGTYQQNGKPRLSDLAEKRAKNLRDNLMRRKQQARSRSEADAADQTSEDEQ